MTHRLIGFGLTALLSGCGSSVDITQASQPLNAAPPLTAVLRTFDGTGNTTGDAGSAETVLRRSIPAAYGDGIGTPAGATRPSPREVSNLCVAQTGELPDAGGRSDFVWAWGQFLDHDISITHIGTEPLNIAVPTGDPSFDPLSTGNEVLPFSRSEVAPGTGVTTVRQHLNYITAFIDGSGVYGSDNARASALRTFSGGMLATSAGNFPPFNAAGLAVDNPLGLDPTTLFLCGDTRANEHIVLTSLHTIFIREHNFWAQLLAGRFPGWTDEDLYQAARKIVGAEIQIITYNEFLPTLLGPDPLPPYTGYQASVDPQIDTTFSAAAYRIGHTMVGTELLRLDSNGQPIAQGNILIRNAFFQPQLLITEGGVDPVLRGLAAHRMQTIDTRVVDDLRNFLFGPPGAGGMDLSSMNIQRGRDHGLADYNTVRQSFGLPAVTQFSDITSDLTRQNQLATLYGNVDNIDPWVGLLSEDHVPGTATGPTHRAILIDQFQRLRDGDRFFYLNDPTLVPYLPELENTKLSDIIFRNSGAELQQNVFVTP